MEHSGIVVWWSALLGAFVLKIITQFIKTNCWQKQYNHHDIVDYIERTKCVSKPSPKVGKAWLRNIHANDRGYN